jgi:hypothetical protein
MIDFRPKKFLIFFSFISTDVITLATLRSIQGIGAAAMVPAGVSPYFSIVMDLFDLNFYNNPARNSCSCVPTFSCPYSSICHIFSWSGPRRCLWFKRRRSFGRIYTVRLVPVILVLIIYISIYYRDTWRSPFYLLTGLIVVVLISGLFSIDADLPSKETDKRVDWIGAFLVTTGLVLIIFVLGQGEIAPRQWATPCT